jgi:Family of unknown function (DUF6879)
VTTTELPANLTLEQWAGLLRSASHGACHLEMRDVYVDDEEVARFREWRETGQLGRDDHPWFDLIAELSARGVQVRRARIVSEPVSSYIRFEHAGAWQNVEAGEQVRWLARRLASRVALPGNDFWLLDGERVLFNLFDGDGRPAGKELADDATAVKLCASAFETVWELATPHEEYMPA